MATPDEELADQKWLTRDARDCARFLFTLLSDETQRQIVEDGTWEWPWLLWSELAEQSPWPPSTHRRQRERRPRHPDGWSEDAR